MNYPGSGDLVLPLDEVSILFIDRGELTWDQTQIGLVLRTVMETDCDVPLLDVLVGNYHGRIYADATKRLI